MIAAWIFALLLLAPAAYPCDPMPLAGCEDKELIPLDSASFEVLMGKAAAFQAELTKDLKKAKAKSASSCFNQPLAEMYLKETKAFAAEKKGKICASHIPQIKKSVEKLIDADSLERKAIKNTGAKGRLSLLTKETKAALEEFLHHH